MPYTVTEYAGGRGEILATFARPSDAVKWAMSQTTKCIPIGGPEDLSVLYRGARSNNDDSPWLVVEASAQCPMCGSVDTFDDNGTRECRQCGSRWFRTPPSEVSP